LDTGALIALERRRQRIRSFLEVARQNKIPLVVPGVCIAEWWRGRTDLRERILATLIVEHTDDELVKLTGEALAVVKGATCIDAMVMATAARRGGVVLTSDVEDLTRLQAVFSSIRVLSV
jgi:predicted nucleic acid-binding protein